MLCPLCKLERDDQPHVLECLVLKRKFKSTDTLIDKVHLLTVKGKRTLPIYLLNLGKFGNHWWETTLKLSQPQASQ